MSTMYTSGEYLDHHPSWHTEDSPWKARHILRVLQRHPLPLRSIAEVGCGAGEILNQLYQALPEDVTFHGYEVSADAHRLSQERAQPRLQFHLADLTETASFFDLLLVIDVFEHVEDYLGFLRRLRKHATHVLFHIPLDLSAQTVLRGHALLATREAVGHLHYFTEETALATLRDAGYAIDDYVFTARGVELSGGGWKRRVARLPRKLLAAVSASWASRLLGGFSLLVLAHPQEAP